MLGRLIRKELLCYLLDFRFIAVFAFCVLLSVLSIYMGMRNYIRQNREYALVSETNRRASQVWLDKNNLGSFTWVGYRWNRPPEVLSPVVYGLSGILGSEADIQHEQFVEFEGALYEDDPGFVLFGVLDLAFIIKVVLSLAVLLFTYDAVCGEKETGTLRLYASFPVARSTIALAKLLGCTAAVLIPFLFAYLLASAVLALSPDMGLQNPDWLRMGALLGVFALYLTIFVAFGLFVSALTHRRMTAFLGLLGLWTVWIFIIPDAAVYLARSLVPAKTVYELDDRSREMLRETSGEAEAERDAYFQRNGVEDPDRLPEARQKEIGEDLRAIRAKWEGVFYNALGDMQTERRNSLRRQQRMAKILSAISPFSVVSFLSMEMARTGFVQQERIENAVDAHLVYLAQYIRQKGGQPDEGRDLTDFSWFTYQDDETIWQVLSRNAFLILNLALFIILGFTGAYVAILRYDVR